MKIKEFGSHIIDMYANGFDEDALNTEFSKSGFEEFHKITVISTYWSI